jgi:AraC-like DNA-binding protein/ABC-type sugar transport system substrate-binding protein
VDYVPVGPWNTDGLIVVNPLFAEARSQYVQSLIAAGHPVVFAATGEAGPTVAIDNAGAIRQAILHLVAHGHRQIAFIAGYPNDLTGDSGIRLQAFQQIVQEYGLDSHPSLIAYGNHGIDGGQDAMRRILDSGVPFTAVLASNDESAIGAMNTLKARGLRVPEDVAIIGNDDTVEAIAQVPPLTTFRSSPFQMGYRALELLLDVIEARSPALDCLTIPTQLIVRQSCGCRPSAVAKSAVPATAPPVSPEDTRLLTSQLAKTMTDIALAGTQRLSPGELEVRCQRLVEAFVESLASNDPAGFRQSLEEILKRVEALEDDMYVWNTTLSALESGWGSLRSLLDRSPADGQPEAMLAEARAVVAQYMQRQHRHVLSHQIWIADRIGQLNARLLTALDEAQIYEILASYLPQIGVRQMGVAFFEAQDEDPFACCSLHNVSEHGEDFHFPSRQFPPVDLYEEPYQLALLPMASREETPGFVVFEVANLEICAPIVWQLVTFLKVVRLYRIEAILRRNGTLGTEAQRIVRKAMAYLHEHYMEPISLEETARHVSVSKEYLARCFRHEMGVPLVKYLNRYRVRQAKTLLQKGEHNLTEIALETGFASSAYFSRVFRQEVGMSPRKYKKPVTPAR